MARPSIADLARLLTTWLVAGLALAVAVELLPGLTATSAGPLVVAAAVSGAVGMVVRPLLVGVAAKVGWWAIALLAVAGQAVVMQVALELVPGVDSSSFWSTVAAAWIAAVVGTFVSWLLTAATPEAMVTGLKRSTRHHGPVADPDVDGVVFVQLDGVPHPVMRWALQSGTMPTLRSWLDAGTHRLHRWDVQMPCTTPASQLGILHGTCDGVPAFRWYDRELGRVLVGSRPADAAAVEKRASTGRGLLADDGVSVSNIFSGDARRSLMTMSRIEVGRGSRDTRRVFAWFAVRPDGFTRSVARTVAEVVRERRQASRQRRRRVWPRVHRSWTFALLRAFSNGLLRDMNTAVVADEMMRGTRAMYVDYVDYDEVAHHAGGPRLESLAALEALDEALGVLARLAESAPRRYHFVILSDHGQSMGAPFADRFGLGLGELCASLTQKPTTSLDENVESWGRVGSLVDDLAGPGRTSQQATRHVGDHLGGRADAPRPAGTESDVVVLGSGNLGLVYFREPERLRMEDLDRRYPRLLPGLAAHPGISFVAVLSREEGPVVIGARGRCRLRDGAVEGEDPLEPFGRLAPRLVATATAMAEAPDVYVNSSYDADTGEIAAFESLVGAHGGLGGWQEQGMLVAPVELHPTHTDIVGAEELHHVLVDMLVRVGHRAQLVPEGRDVTGVRK
jgi:uncharacterized membrane protein YvlD (DUF360 family)